MEIRTKRTRAPQASKGEKQKERKAGRKWRTDIRGEGKEGGKKGTRTAQPAYVKRKNVGNNPKKKGPLRKSEKRVLCKVGEEGKNTPLKKKKKKTLKGREGKDWLGAPDRERGKRGIG